MDKFFGNIIGVLVALYMIIASFYSYKFYYDDTKTSSLTEWYFIGELKAGIKGVIWPYYFFTDDTEIKHNDEESLKCFRQSMDYRNTAMDYFDMIEKTYETNGVIFTVNKDDPNMQLSFKYLQMALDEAHRVSPHSLNVIDDSLQEQYNIKFIKGLELYIQGNETNDIRLTTTGLLLLESFGEYYSRLYDRINH